MPYEDVPGLVAKLGKSESVGRLALQFVILTAARSGEVRGATWTEIDTKAATWIVPAERMKAGREHVVPLSDAALAVLERVNLLRRDGEGEPVFPGLGGRVMSDVTLAKVLRTAGVGAFTVHGFRSSFRDWAAEQTAIPGEVVESALAHTVRNKVEAAYRRTLYLEKRRILMAAWSQYLSETEGNVVILSRPKTV